MTHFLGSSVNLLFREEENGSLFRRSMSAQSRKEAWMEKTYSCYGLSAVGYNERLVRGLRRG